MSDMQYFMKKVLIWSKIPESFILLIYFFNFLPLNVLIKKWVELFC
jgi:hypothetical protein